MARSGKRDKAVSDFTERVLTFWFAPKQQPKWFASDAVFDQAILKAFLDDYHRFLSFSDEMVGDGRGRLALILLYDQCPRNMFRDLPEMFATDEKALQLTYRGLAKKEDRALSLDERRFFYMPLMHSEVIEDQELGVQLFRDYVDAMSYEYAIQHRDIIKRFGRFPHRNRILGRDTNEEEAVFLTQPGSSF